MKKTFEKSLVSFLSFSLVCMMMFISVDHLEAQNSSDLSPAALESFSQKMNEEIIDLRMEMNNPGVNADNNHAIFDYYIAVRDYYLANPVELQQAFKVQLWKLRQHDISLGLSNALLDESTPPSGPAGSHTAVVGSPSSNSTAINLSPTAQYQSFINQLQIVDNQPVGFDNLFQFIRSRK